MGDANADTRAVKLEKANHYSLANKKGGKPTTTGTIELSTDGKTRTLVTHSTDAAGKKASATFVYDKQ